MASTSRRIREFNEGIVPTESNLQVVVFPTECHLTHVMSKLRRDFGIGAQDCSRRLEEVLTGEVSANTLRDLGVRWILLGQCDRRHVSLETEEDVAEKVDAATTAGLHVVLCVGESIAQREEGESISVVLRQLDAIMDKVWRWENMVIAYEPQVAKGELTSTTAQHDDARAVRLPSSFARALADSILRSVAGTGETLPFEEINEVCDSIRGWMRSKLCDEVVDRVRVLYGGSVRADNCRELVHGCRVDGFLVEEASLTQEFLYIVNCAMIRSGDQESEAQALRTEVGMLLGEIAKMKGENEPSVLLETIVSLKRELVELQAMSEFTTCTDGDE